MIFGTAALEAPDRLERIAGEFPGRIDVGIDARDGRVATRGWTQTTAVRVEDAAAACRARGAAGIIYHGHRPRRHQQGVNVAATARTRGRGRRCR